MRKTLIAAAALAAVAIPAGIALAQPQGPGGGPRGPARLFEQADADRDGRVTATEAAAFLQARFDAADADKDGKLSAAELRNLRPDARPAPTEGWRAQRAAERSATMLRGLDSDRDGFVSIAELRPVAEAMFRMADKNVDGVVARDELPQRGHGRDRGPDRR